MSTLTPAGSPQFPTIADKVSTHEEMDQAIHALQEHKDTWVATTLQQRVSLLTKLIQNIASLAPRWVEICSQAKHLSPQLTGEEWSMGPWPILRNLRLLRQSLLDIEAFGRPRIPGPVTTRDNGQVVAQVFPTNNYDRIFFTSMTAEIWMEPGVSAETLPQTQALIYQKGQAQQLGMVALVLGAGNVSSIAPTDVLYKLFVENQVVLLKMNPVNAYLGPLIEEGFQPLVEQGFLRVTYGGAKEGSYLCDHPGIEEIHVTGSDKTFDAIVFGPGSEGTRRKAEKQPLCSKRVTGELGNVSPVIVVPGPWSEADLRYQAEHIFSMLTTNAGFNCNATRVIITHKGWDQREALLNKLRELMAAQPARQAYYPGAQQRMQSFVEAHPQAERFGATDNGNLPWTLITDVDPKAEDDICFTTEAFCSLFAETALEANGVVDYIQKAVNFANEDLWGTLNVTLLVHPKSRKDPAASTAVEQAIANLHYGTVSLNYWAGTSFTLGCTTWGAYPGHAIDNIQSGVGVVHNTYMFSHPQKSVVRAPFKSTPTPPWFATRGQVLTKTFPLLADFEAQPSPWKVPSIVLAALGR
jgi:acyl-CoA reductase-like NAD-dependent aldehyde dehydrogenase